MYINISLSKRVLKKIIKYLVLFLIGCIAIFYVNHLEVKAATIPSDCIFYDNYGSYQNQLLTIAGLDDNGNYTYYTTETSFILTAGSTGSLLVCSLDTPVLPDKVYTLSMYVELPSGTSATLSSKPNLGIGTTNANARTSYINNTNVIENNYNASNSVLTYVFTSSTTANYIAIPFTSNTSTTTNPYLRNLVISYQGEANQLSEEDIKTIIDNSNSQTQEVIKDTITDNFNSCTPSNNLLDSTKHTAIATNKFTYSYIDDRFQFVLTSASTSSGGTFPLGFQVSLQPNTTYTLSWYDIVSNSSTRAYFYIYTGGWSTNLFAYSEGSDELTFTTDSNTTYYIQYYISGSYNANEVVNLSSIMLNTGSSAKPFESYGEKCTNKLDDLNENQQATNDKLDDLNDNITNSDTNGADDKANSFFDNFENTDHGGISGVVSAPLELIKSLINNNNVCSNLNFSVFDKDVYFPSGCILWDKVPDSFITIWNVLICGLGSYGILIALFKDIEKLKTPESKGVDTLDL